VSGAAVHDVTLLGESDAAYRCGEDETLLEAAERAGFALPYSCRKGICLTCEATLVAGTVNVRGAGLMEGPREAVRLCVARPVSPVKVQPQRVEHSAAPERKQLLATVYRITQRSPDVTVVDLRLPIGVRAKFRAGQYLTVFLQDGGTRNFSMANAPQKREEVQLHIRRIDGGAFSEVLLPTLSKGDKLQVELPFGQFVRSEATDARALFLATGTGFAPFKSMIEDQIATGGKRQVKLYWGVRRREDLYLAALVEGWAARHSWFSFTPLLSQPDAGWTGRTGRICGAVQQDHANLSGWEVYACGNPAMVAAARAELAPSGLSSGNFFCESFVPSGDAP
jgi:NAD(P)H-flavin reductase/ferredoxin